MEIKAIITEYSISNRKETTRKEIIRTEDDIINFKSIVKSGIKNRQEAFSYIRKTDFYFVSDFTGMWQMTTKESITNSDYVPLKGRGKAEGIEASKVDRDTIEVEGKLRSLKITAAVSRGWNKILSTMPMTPSEITLAKSILASPSGRMSAKQYMTMKELKEKANRRKPIR